MNLLGPIDSCLFVDLEVDYMPIFMMGSCWALLAVDIAQSLEAGVSILKCCAWEGCFRILGICCCPGCRRVIEAEATSQNYGCRCLYAEADAFDPFLSADENMEFQIISLLLLSFLHQSPCISWQSTLPTRTAQIEIGFWLIDSIGSALVLSQSYTLNRESAHARAHRWVLQMPTHQSWVHKYCWWSPQETCRWVNRC